MQSLLTAAVAEAFSEDGPLARADAQFRPRAGQRRMAEAIAQTVQTGGVLVVEAGTGVGKTFAYLVPALLSGQRVLVSTATKALQEQLFARDLPRLLRALALPRKAALLKGRSSYLCLYRLEHARHGGPGMVLDPQWLRALAHIEVWARSTQTGDLSELPGLEERSPVMPLVTSTHENCLGTPCSHWSACHVNQARQKAMAADVVVVNHHLFFADLAVRESGMAELLPTLRVVVFDEAHQLNEIGVHFLGVHTGTGRLQSFAREVLATGQDVARGYADWLILSGQMERALRDLRQAMGTVPSGSRLPWPHAVPDGVAAKPWLSGMKAVDHALHGMQSALALVRDAAPALARLHERAVELAAGLAHFGGDCTEGAVRWLDVAGQLGFTQTPLDLAQTLQGRLWATSSDSRSRAWVFTSATLGEDDHLRWFTEPCGLQGATVLRVGSPFDYARQAALYVPDDMPQPADPGHSACVAALVASAAACLGGRTLVLTTSLKALHGIGAALQLAMAAHGIEVLVQGSQPKRRLLERFRAGNGRGTGGVLVASVSFWEGVDVPGDALQLVVIDKLPFPVPSDPLVAARSQRLQAQGRSPFRDYALPEAAVALKQGAGRLIRHELDQGVLVVCDPRLLRMGYGPRLLAALPPMRLLADAEDFAQTLERLVQQRASGT